MQSPPGNQFRRRDENFDFGLSCATHRAAARNMLYNRFME